MRVLSVWLLFIAIVVSGCQPVSASQVPETNTPTMLPSPTPTPTLTYTPMATATATLTATPVPTPSGGGAGWIAYTSCADGNSVKCEIYAMNVNGGNPIRLTYNLIADGEPTWSPDGTKIIFLSASQLVTIDADGKNWVELTDPNKWKTASYFDPNWSPDGTKIAVLVFGPSDPHGGIYVMDSSGSNPIRVTDGDASVRSPAWSPDGKRITFAYTPWPYSPGSGHSEIYIINTDGSGLRQLTNNDVYDGQPVWSPDGKKIAYVSVADVATNLQQIFIMNPDGGSPIQLSFSQLSSLYPAWSPDGRQIAFVSIAEGIEKIFLINVDGSEQRQLTEGSNWDSSPAWQPATREFVPEATDCTDGWSRIERAFGARVPKTASAPLAVRSEPSMTSAVVNELNAGAIVSLIGPPPVCADGLVFWDIYYGTYPNNMQGWLPEGDGKEYWLEPLP